MESEGFLMDVLHVVSHCVQGVLYAEVLVVKWQIGHAAGGKKHIKFDVW